MLIDYSILKPILTLMNLEIFVILVCILVLAFRLEKILKNHSEELQRIIRNNSWVATHSTNRFSR